MSRSSIKQRKSSPCCIGCIVLLIIALGLSLAMGIYMYRFAKNNISLVSVMSTVDPALDTPSEQLLPPQVGDFSRVSLADTLENVPDWKDLQTSGVYVAVYRDPEAHEMTVIAIPTEQAQAERQTGIGVLTAGRGTASAPDSAVSIKDTFSGPQARYITTWSKPNWTFMVQTSSTLTSKFMENFHPGTVTHDDAAPAVEAAPEPAADETSAPAEAPVAPAVEETPAAPAQDPAPVASDTTAQPPPAEAPAEATEETTTTP